LTGTIGKPLVDGDIDVAKGAIRNEPFDRLTARVSYSGRSVGLAAGNSLRAPNRSS